MSIDTAETLLNILATAVSFYAKKMIIEAFLPKKMCRIKHTGYLYILACALVSLVYELFPRPFFLVLANMTALMLVLAPYRVRTPKKLLLAGMIYVMAVLVESIIVLPSTQFVLGDYFEQEYECIVSLAQLLIAIIIKRTIATKKPLDIELPKIYNVTLGSIPVMSIACIYYMGVTARNLKSTILVVAFVLLFINVGFFYLYDALLRFYSDQNEKKEMERITEAYRCQLNIIQESQERMETVRHDLKHHIFMLSGLIRDDKNDKAIQYLDKMREFMLNPDEYSVTGNSDIDGILNYMLRDANEKLRTVKVNIKIPDDFQTDFNTTIIVGNLVDNAVREAQKSGEKFLDINMKTEKGILMIFIENSYVGKIVEKEKRFVTSQQNKNIHGIGLESVKKIVSSLDGKIDFDYDEGRFRVQVLLYLTQK